MISEINKTELNEQSTVGYEAAKWKGAQVMRKPICILLTLALFTAMIPAAFAAGGPSDEDLKAIGSKIEKPKTKEYLKDYVYAVVKAPKEYSVFGYGSADRAGTKYEVMDGEWVVVLAERGGMSCCIVLSEQAGRWINSDYLLVDGKEPARPNGPNAMDLKDIKSHIEFPKDKEYLKNYEYAVVRAPKGHSVFGYGAANRTGNSFTVLDGEEVMILAERGGMSCCIVLSDQVGRWINSDYLENIPAPSK